MTRPGVDPSSLTETYVAARLAVDNWRWAEVPFYVRTGKRLAKRVSEVAIQFKRVPHLPFSYAAAEQLEPNVLVLRIQPNEGIALRFGAKVPSTRTQIRTVNMDFDYDTAFATAPAEAYETLLVDALRGDATNFIRIDAVTGRLARRGSRPARLAERGRRAAPVRGRRLGARGGGRPAGARRAQVAAAVSAIAAVEERLAELRGGERGEARTQLLDLVVLADDPREAERMATPARAAAGQPPLAGDHRAGRARSARARGERRGRDDAPRRAATGELRCELVRLAAGDEGAALPSLIAGLLLPDLPVFLLLRLDPERWEPLVNACWSFATRVVVDSTGERSGLHSLPGLLAREPTRSVTDLSWTKLTGWRELVARLFDPPRADARAGTPRPHRGDARRPLECPGAAAGGLDPEPDRSAPERGADERAAAGHALGLAHQRRADVRQGALRGGARSPRAWPRCARRTWMRSRRGSGCRTCRCWWPRSSESTSATRASRPPSRSSRHESRRLRRFRCGDRAALRA